VSFPIYHLQHHFTIQQQQQHITKEAVETVSLMKERINQEQILYLVSGWYQ